MHDAKFTYCMLQCSGWARKHQPFCSCKCHCGEGAIDGHISKMFSAEEYRSLYKKSKDRMNSQKNLSAIRPSGAYTDANHWDWVDEHNFGVYHHGIPPMLWNIGSLVFNYFHGLSAYVKLQNAFIRKLFEGNFDSIEKFSIFWPKHSRRGAHFKSNHGSMMSQIQG